MNRRTALAAAGAVVLTVAAGSMAVAANLGLLSESDEAVGELSPKLTSVDTGGEPVEIETIYVDETIQVPAGGPDSGPAPGVPAGDDERYEDDESEDGFEDESDHEEEHEEEHEGWDDDD